jgi:hypothetical protein
VRSNHPVMILLYVLWTLYEAAQRNKFLKAGFYEPLHIVNIILHTLRNGCLESYRVYTSSRIENCALYRSVSRCRRAHARGAVVLPRTRGVHTVILNDWQGEWLQCTRPAEGWSIPPAPQQRYWESLLSSEVGHNIDTNRWLMYNKITFWGIFQVIT